MLNHLYFKWFIIYLGNSQWLYTPVIKLGKIWVSEFGRQEMNFS